MHFKRTKGQYRETDRVTRFKLIKSGKHWLRAATSYFGLFRVLKGGVDKASVDVYKRQALERAVSPATDVLAASDSAVLGHSTAVSYTHLDVYKRQILFSMMKLSKLSIRV